MKEWFAMIGSIILAVGAFFLIRGVRADEPAALMTLGAIISLALIVMGGSLVLTVVWFANRMQRDREEREQGRFVDNAKENLAIMGAMQKVQNQQNSMLMRQARDATRALPSPADTLDIDALVYSDAVFDELED